jgi:hypothetical protein
MKGKKLGLDLGLFRKGSGTKAFTSLSVIFSVCLLGNSVAADEAQFASRQDAWRRCLDGHPFIFGYGETVLLDCVEHFTGPGQLHLVRDSEHEPHLAIKLVREDSEILSLKCHRTSTFAATKDQFFFADFDTDTPGCVVRAFDVTTGKELWKTEELNGFGGFGHSAYRNLVQIGVPSNGMNIAAEEKSGVALVVAGRESYGDYITIVDTATGRILASKIYRKGFAPIKDQPWSKRHASCAENRSQRTRNHLQLSNSSLIRTVPRRRSARYRREKRTQRLCENPPC